MAPTLQDILNKLLVADNAVIQEVSGLGSGVLRVALAPWAGEGLETGPVALAGEGKQQALCRAPAGPSRGPWPAPPGPAGGQPGHSLATPHHLPSGPHVMCVYNVGVLR